MSTADHVLDQIDSALNDYTVSDDAMRSAPLPADSQPATRLEIMSEDGEWQEVPGVASIEITADPAATAARLREAQESIVRFFHAYAEAVRPRIEELGRALAAASQAVRDAGLVDADGKPARRPDRPAWQSPYGPPRRR
ncbi:hypothetical protein [Streptomyces scabiei]|uniref:hypothetical protein n=1 Tax=Streptomyces scabiei TaxID=1930 RepID=UPI000765C6FE|nr:hypothetical protein [Streptomyces scabiei]